MFFTRAIFITTAVSYFNRFLCFLAKWALPELVSPHVFFISRISRPIYICATLLVLFPKLICFTYKQRSYKQNYKYFRYKVWNNYFCCLILQLLLWHANAAKLERIWWWNSVFKTFQNSFQVKLSKSLKQYCKVSWTDFSLFSLQRNWKLIEVIG